jgi:Ca2+:H+ antiporter
MASPHVDQINEKRATVSASPEPIVNTVDPSMVSGGTPTAGATAYTAENGHPTDNLSRAHTASAASMRARVENTKRPPPFSRKVTKSLFIKPPSQRVRP